MNFQNAKLIGSGSETAIVVHLKDQIKWAERRLLDYRRRSYTTAFHYTDGQLDAMKGLLRWIEQNSRS